jgi:hypothetical protein
MWLEGLDQFKNPVTSSGIEAAMKHSAVRKHSLSEWNALQDHIKDFDEFNKWEAPFPNAVCQ